MLNAYHRLVALALLALALTGFAQASGPDRADSFFAAALPNLEHRPFDAADLRGKPILVNFWATWCSPCRAEIPALDEVARNGKPKNLAVVGIALDDDPAAVRAFIAGQDVSYPILVGKEAALVLMRDLGNDKGALPFTVAVDRSGKIVHRKFGMLRRGDFARMLASLGQAEAVSASDRR